MKQVIVSLMLVLVGSAGAVTSQIPADGDLWTEDSSLIGCWISGNGGTVEYVSDDVAVGTYAVKNSNPNTGYFAGLGFKMTGTPLDLSNPTAMINFSEKLTFSTGLEYVNVQYRIYTDASWGSNFYFNDKITSDRWQTYAGSTGLSLHSLFTGIDGTPDWSHVYGVGIFITQNMPGVATTVSVDGLSFTVGPANCAAALAGGYSLPGDLNNDCYVDMKDFSIFASNWLGCLGTNPECSHPWVGAYGRTAYNASPVSGTVTIDGVLDSAEGWPAFDYTPESSQTSNWVAIDRNYHGTPTNVANAYMCLMHDATHIYGAVIVDDSNGVYGYSAWNGQDNIELYIQGNSNNDVPADYTTYLANAQSYGLGLNADKTSTWMQWSDGVQFGYHETEVGSPAVEGKVKRTVVGGVDKMVYEFKLTAYNNYGGLNGSATTITNLVQGSTVGFDVVLSNKSTNPAGFGMLCPNVNTGKYGNIAKFGLVTCQ